MNGDLSLSQALGGLRIANPDGDSDEEPQEAAKSTAATATEGELSHGSQPSRSDDVPLGQHISSHTNPPDIPNTTASQHSASSDQLVHHSRPLPEHQSQPPTQYPDVTYKHPAHLLRRAQSARLGPSSPYSSEQTPGWGAASPYPDSPYIGLSRTDSRAGAAYAGSTISRAPSQRVKMNRGAPGAPGAPPPPLPATTTTPNGPLPQGELSRHGRPIRVGTAAAL
jgi:3-phosphoinositide dependent protein kinase-1